MKKKTVVMKLNAEKKGSVRYDAEGDNGLLSTIYVLKPALEGVPEKIKVTIEDA